MWILLSVDGENSYRGLCGGGGWLLKGMRSKFLSGGQVRSWSRR